MNDYLKALIVVFSILLVFFTIFSFALWHDGYQTGRESIQDDMFRDLVAKSYYDLYITEGNQTNLIKLTPLQQEE